MTIKNLLILISVLIISGGLVFSFFYNVWAQTAGITATVKITVCGNNTVEEGEECDGSNLAGQDCKSLGYDGGILSCYPDCTFDTSGCTAAPPPAGGGWAPRPTVTKVVLEGKAYPLSSITVLQDGKVITTIKADSLANFRVEITNITVGTWTFGLWAEDKEGRRSITSSFTISVSKGKTTTIGGIFIPPTIELEKTSVLKGEALNILGQTAPKSEVSISVEPPEIVKKTESETDGKWFYSFDTTILEEGSYTVRAKAETPEGLLSSFSQALEFYLEKVPIEEVCPYADFNRDGKTNMIDFSVLLYWWGKANPCVDQDRNGVVDLVDFSIMMYYWIG